MKVLILTKTEYRKFIVDVVSPYSVQDDKYVWNVTIVDETMSFIPLDYDIGISFMWTKKVPARHVNTHTWINFHPGPLPEYKGRNLCYHAIMNMETEFGATIHYMDEGFDTGDIIDVIKFPVKDYYTAGDVSLSAIQCSKTLFELYFPRIIAGEEFERLPNVGVGYYGKGAIPDTLEIRADYGIGQFVRAVTCGDFYPKLNIGGLNYKIVRDE